MTCALFSELIDPEDKLAHPTATDMAAPYEWQVSLAKLLRTFERNRIAAESAAASSTQGQWTALTDTDLQECIRSTLPKAQVLASLDPSMVPTVQPGVFPTLAKVRILSLLLELLAYVPQFSPEDIMFRFAMLQHLNRVILNLHDRLELPLARVRSTFLLLLLPPPLY